MLRLQSQGNQQLRCEGAAALIRLRRKMGREGESTGLWGEDGCFCAKTKAERLHGHHDAKDRIYGPLRSQIHLD